MVSEVIELLKDRWSFFSQLLVEHLMILAIVILIAGIVGLILGITISEWEKASEPVLGITNFIYTIPSISLLGFLTPFTGIGNMTAFLTLIIYALLAMVRNTYKGMKRVDEEILEVAKGLGSTKWQVLYKIKLPLALPYIISGLRKMLIMTIGLTGFASFIGADGLGVAIYRGITTKNTAMIVAGSVLIAAMAFAFELIFSVLEILFSYNRLKRMT